MRTLLALALGITLGASTVALAQPPLTRSRFVLASSTTDIGPKQVKFVRCPADWSLPSFEFRFVGYDPTNDRLVLACPEV